MKSRRSLPVIPLLVLTVTSLSTSSALAQASQAQTPQPASPPTLAADVDREITAVEKLVVDAAEAMPEEKFNFSPESLNIPGDDYKGVRSFAVQVKHIASSNYFIWSHVTGDAVPAFIKDGNGPAEMKTKAEILKFLRDSFALGHKAAATLTAQNMMEAAAGSKSTRLHLTEFGEPTLTTITDRWWNICG